MRTLDFIQVTLQQQFAVNWSAEIQLNGKKQSFLQKFQAGHGFDISNGSYCSGTDMAAWIIEDSTLANQMIGLLIVPISQYLFCIIDPSKLN